MSDLFKNASKKKYRFNYKGVCSTEDLWDLNVESLDAIYKALKKEQKATEEESLLAACSKEDKVLEEKIEIVKTIVADKLAAKERAKNEAKRRADNQKILAIIADKKEAALKEKSLDELRAMLVDEEPEEE